MFQKDVLIELMHKNVIISSKEELIIRSDGVTEGSYLFDFRKVLLSPEYLPIILDGFLEMLAGYSHYQVGGIESAAIPLITGLVLRKGVSGFYMRKSRKKTGLLHQFEGEIDPKVPIILVDDIINSGESILKQVYALEKEGFQVSAILSIFRFHPIEWYDQFRERNIKIHSLVTHDEIAQNLGIPTLSHDKNISFPYSVITPKARFSVESPRFNLMVPRPIPYFDGKYIYTGMDDGSVYALEPHLGKVVWKFETFSGSNGKKILSSCTGNGKYIFFGAYDGNMYALDAQTGKLVWKNETADWIGSSPCYISKDNTVCVGMEYSGKSNVGGYTLFDADTGEILWSIHTPKYTHASPIYSQKYDSIFGGSNEGLFYRIDQRSGKIVWMVSVEAEIKNRATLSEDEEYIIFGAHNGTLYVLESATGKEIFRFEAKYAIYSNPSTQGSMVYFSSLDKNIYAIDFKKKQLVWSFETYGRVFSSPILHQGLIYCGSNDGDLYLLNRDDGKLVKKWQGTERIMSPVTFINEKNFVVRTIANELYLF